MGSVGSRLLSGLLACVLVGCASLPQPHARAWREAQRISDARGWQGYQQSRATAARFASGDGRDFFALHMAVEEAVASSPLVRGNQVTLLDDGPATYQAMYEAIDSAREFIHLETYIFDADEIGYGLAERLARKRAEGVAVAVMVDGIGTLGTAPALFDLMRDAGVQLVVFNPVNPLQASTTAWSLNQRNHRKTLVVDGKVGFIGGINISNVYASSPGAGSGASQGQGGEPPWRDTHVRIEGPAVAELERVFLSGWQLQNGPALVPREFFPEVPAAGEHVVRILANDPRDRQGYSIYLTLMSAISSAQRSIHITMAYFVPDPAMVEALKDAAARGVRTVLVLPAFSDSSLVLHAGRSHYAELLRAGVRIHERDDALLHAKTAVIDGVWSTVGSSNLDWRSFALNYEVNAVVLGASFAGKLEALFEHDLEHASEVTLAAWEQRGIGTRFMEFIGRLGERWL